MASGPAYRLHGNGELRLQVALRLLITLCKKQRNYPRLFIWTQYNQKGPEKWGTEAEEGLRKRCYDRNWSETVNVPGFEDGGRTL